MAILNSTLGYSSSKSEMLSTLEDSSSLCKALLGFFINSLRLLIILTNCKGLPRVPW